MNSSLLKKRLDYYRRPLRIKGAEFDIPDSLAPLESFFIPSLKHKETFAAVERHYKNRYPLVWAERIENGTLGIRVWCTP